MTEKAILFGGALEIMHILYYYSSTVEPLYNKAHHQGRKFCPLQRGVLITDVEKGYFGTYQRGLECPYIRGGC